jgi:hypothetical protein
MKSSLFRRTTRVASAAAVVVTTVAVLSAAAEAAGVGAATTSSVLTAAKSAIGKQVSVHLVVTSRSSASAVEEQLGADLGKASGRETISEGSAAVMIRVVPSYAYFSGNSSGLTKIFGLTAAEVKKVGADWVAVKAGTTQYKDLATPMTVSSVASVLPAVKGTKLYSPAPSGQNPYTLKWQTGATSSQPALANTLTISAVGATLPILETTTATGGGKQTVALSKWGERVVVSAPAPAAVIPLAKVVG